MTLGDGQSLSKLFQPESIAQSIENTSQSLGFGALALKDIFQLNKNDGLTSCINDTDPLMRKLLEGPSITFDPIKEFNEPLWESREQSDRLLKRIEDLQKSLTPEAQQKQKEMLERAKYEC